MKRTLLIVATLFPLLGFARGQIWVHTNVGFVPSSGSVFDNVQYTYPTLVNSYFQAAPETQYPSIKSQGELDTLILNNHLARAADGDKIGMFFLGKDYLYGEHGAKVDYREAAKYLRQCLEVSDAASELKAANQQVALLDAAENERRQEIAAAQARELQKRLTADILAHTVELKRLENEKLAIAADIEKARINAQVTLIVASMKKAEDIQAAMVSEQLQKVMLEHQLKVSQLAAAAALQMMNAQHSNKVVEMTLAHTQAMDTFNTLKPTHGLIYLVAFMVLFLIILKKSWFKWVPLGIGILGLATIGAWCIKKRN